MSADWPRRRLGELLHVQNGCAFDAKAFSDSGAIPLVRIRDLKNGVTTETRFTGAYDERYVVRAGDLLIGMDGEFACYEWRGEPALLNQRVCRLQGFASTLLPRFVLYGVNSYLKVIEDVTAFATVKHLSSKQVLGIEFPVPPLDEQQRIVAVLDEAFAGIAAARANAERNLGNARALFESELRTLFAATNESASVTLEDVCEDITVGYVGPMARQYRSAGVPFLRSQNVRPFRVNLENLVYVDEAFHLAIAKSRLRPGDVVIVRTGYPGVAAVVPDSLIDSNCSDLVIVRPGPGTDPHFLTLFFNSAYGKELVAGQLVGAAQKHFNVTAAKRVRLSLPSRDEQRVIVARMRLLSNETQRLESVYQRKLAALDELKRSLLHHAFTGQLTGRAHCLTPSHAAGR